MKLQIGIPDYPWESELARVAIRGRVKGRDIALMVLSMPDMKARREALPVLRGLPQYAAFDPVEGLLWLHPSPDGEYELMIEPAAPRVPESARPGAGVQTLPSADHPASASGTLHLPKDERGRWIKR